MKRTANGHASERVEVTPELLDTITTACEHFTDNTRDIALFNADAFAYRQASTPSVVLALVERIRELEDSERRLSGFT